MDKDFLKGIKVGLGIILVISILGIVSAVGFHIAEEVLPGTFNGNYNFNGNISAKMYCDENGNNCQNLSATSNNGFGDWETKSADITYQATTDGFIIVNPSDCAWGYFSVYSDNFTPTTTRRTKGKSYTAGGSQAGATIPIKKNDYWEVTTTYSCAPDGVYWVPIGN